MPKLASKTKPRLVIYVSEIELKNAKAKAKEAGLRTPHQWGGSVIRKELAASK